MEPIPTWVRILWDAWDIRILVLLSFALQVVLAIFGSVRKYMSSSWISVLVWSSYLMADWVATVALGKLSDAQNSQGNNELWAIWAPLLLLHLGGPDSITAYSLEDNKLWMRHLLGLAVQIFVVIYVILMSWKNSWFLFMSLPVFIAGVAKYGERTWVLKSVNDNEYIDNLPVRQSVNDKEFIDNLPRYLFWDNGDVKALVEAHERLMDFTYRLEDTFYSLSQLGHFPFPDYIATETMWDAVDVEMGLLYDLLYTKVPKVYTLGGCIVRFISFGSTVTVLVGLTIQTIQFNLKEEDDKIDIAITWVLIVGALVLEVYAAIAIFFSHWMMLWLIKKGIWEWVKKLNDRFPWLFKKKKNWSNMLGQFDLLDFWLKQRKRYRKRSIRLVLWKTIMSVIGRKYEEKWNRSLHKTQVSVRPLVRQAISNLCKPENGHSKCHFFDKGHDDELNEMGNLLDRARNNLWYRDEGWVRGWTRDWSTRDRSWGGYWGGNWHQDPVPIPDWYPNPDPDRAIITFMHLATKICYTQSERETNDSSPWKEDRIVSKYLSDYMMYLLMLQPSLLPQSGPSILEEIIDDPQGLVGEDTQEAGEACRLLLAEEGTPWAKIVGFLNGIEDKGRRWKLVKLQWWRILQSAFNNGFRLRDAHLQQLAQGGEFLTFLLMLYTPRLPKARPVPYHLTYIIATPRAQ